MSSYAEDLLSSAERALAKNDLDAAEELLGRALTKAAKELKSNNDDDDDFGDGPSATSMDADNGDDEDDQDDQDDDNDDDDGDEAVDKMLRTLRKDEAFTGRGKGHRNMSAVVGRRQMPETYRADMLPGTSQPTRHKFSAKINEIAERDNVPKHVAQTTARLEHPDLYEDYQNKLSRQATTAQAVVRGLHFVDKRARPSYEAMVAAEMNRAGVTEEIAKVRLAQQYGFRVLDHQSSLSKAAERITDRFQKRVYDIADELGCDLTEASQIARRENPTLFKALQVV
jgi:hypothetical protein